MKDTDLTIQNFLGTHHAAEATELLAERIALIVHKLKFIPDSQRAKVSYLKQDSPLTFQQDTYLDEAIRLAGGIPQSNPQDPNFSPEVLIIIADQSIGTLLSELPTTLSMDFWPETLAVKNNQVFIVHHPEYLRTPSLHPADDVEILAEIIHPGYFV
ncbi:MAG TPA: hypothetical protein VFD72_05740, partial [Sphingobacteriaceae bacterium]|nr:hypothetical protein [Sphingobacteriaceae bacterium]